jgi:hypothetical protein
MKFGDLGDLASDSSSVENWNGYARGGYKQHDIDLREKLREQNRDTEQEPLAYGLRDKYLNQQLNSVDSPILREASAFHTPDIEPSSSKTKLAPPPHTSSMSVSPPKSTFTNLSSAPGVTRNGDQAKLSNGSRTSKPLTGYAGSTGPNTFVSRTNGVRPLAVTPPSTVLQPAAHPQHPVAPQPSQVTRSPKKLRSLEKSITKMANRKTSSSSTSDYQVEPVEDLLIDFS